MWAGVPLICPAAVTVGSAAMHQLFTPTRSSHLYRGLEELSYPFHDHTITVTHCGRICLKVRLADSLLKNQGGACSAQQRTTVLSSWIVDSKPAPPDLVRPAGLDPSFWTLHAGIMSKRAASAAFSSLLPWRAASFCISSRNCSKPAG
jgi:hypothetical protein